ncbi:hypothetical protein BURMUCGD1_5578 [Burkholderia multivorans CGD1]|nr:hypothetical protein BURMUCGD1_5578 [Burkholderia multivorans CGD1]
MYLTRSNTEARDSDRATSSVIDHRHAASPSALLLHTVTVIRMTRITVDFTSRFDLSLSDCRVQLRLAAHITA